MPDEMPSSQLSSSSECKGITHISEDSSEIAFLLGSSPPSTLPLAFYLTLPKLKTINRPLQPVFGSTGNFCKHAARQTLFHQCLLLDKAGAWRRVDMRRPICNE